MSNNQESDTFTIISPNQRVKFYVEKHHETPTEHVNNDQQQRLLRINNSVDKLTSLFHKENSNDRLNQTMDNQSSNKNEITIELKPINNDNKKTVEFIDNVEDLDDLRQELTSSKIKNTELYDEKPLGKILSSILNFNSLIPANKEINEENNDKKKVKPPNKLGTLLGVFLPCVQNIFGVILFIRASWVVGVAGSIHAFLIVLMCCSCTLLTAISTSAIATNGIVPAGGPYFMISRSLGPECGGAVGLLFYLGNTVAASMYIVGAVEIFLKYLFPQLTIIGDIEVQADAFNNFRIYGTIFLIIIGLCVFIGIKFVSKLAPVSLIAVLFSVICIYAGVIVSAFDPPDLKICVFNKTRLIRYDSYVYNQMPFCTNDEWCLDTNRNVTMKCPLWEAYCGKSSITTNSTTTINDDAQAKYFENLCHYFKMKNSVELRLGIPGISNSRPTLENYKSSYLDEGEVYPGEKGLASTEILGKEFTSFLILVGIYFPSVTGIMAGSNRSGDLKDPSRSIPRGTIAAVLTTSFIYLSNVLLFGSCIDGLLLRDKFGDSINKKLVISILAWPNKWIIMIGAFLSTLGAGLQSLTSAPRLLQAVSKDDIIPFLRPLSVSFRGEPFRALMVTLFLTWCGILLGNVDYLTPLIAMFFLMCYGFINMACALQTLLRAPSWRPRYKFYHWTLSLLGLFLCLLIMFIVNWFYAIIAILMAFSIYKYIEYKGAEKEWGDGIRGLSMSAARYALLKLEETPPHVKNWRPQILLLVKCLQGKDKNPKLNQQLSEVEDNNNNHNNNDKNEENEYDIHIQHPNSFAFATQLKAGKGLFVCASVIPGNFIDNVSYAKACRKYLKKTMNKYKAKGFCDSLVSNNIEEGISHLIQTEGLGGLRHNTIILNWPEKWNKEYFQRSVNTNYESIDEESETTLSLSAFVQTLRFGNANESALIITKGIDEWPCNSKTDPQSGTIDLWWIIHDGGLLLLIVFLLKKHKIWQKCKLRLFTVAHLDENSIQIKNDLAQYMYFLRIDAEVEVIEMNDSEISAYTYEKTLKLHEREKLLKNLKLNEKAVEIEPQSVLERVRRNSLKSSSHHLLNTYQESTFESNEANLNQYTFSASYNTRRPSVIHTDTIRKMHSAVELNKKILEKSKDSSLVLMNIPAPPKGHGTADYNYMSYIQASTEGLNRVLLVRGSGREVITIFS